MGRCLMVLVEEIVWCLWTSWVDRPCVTIVPVLEISDRRGRLAELALELFGE